MFVPRDRTSGHGDDEIANLARIFLVVNEEARPTDQVLVIEAVADGALYLDHPRLGHFVAYHDSTHCRALTGCRLLYFATRHRILPSSSRFSWPPLSAPSSLSWP